MPSVLTVISILSEDLSNIGNWDLLNATISRLNTGISVIKLKNAISINI